MIEKLIIFGAGILIGSLLTITVMFVMAFNAIKPTRSDKMPSKEEWRNM